jgi:hypothetical protein
MTTAAPPPARDHALRLVSLFADPEMIGLLPEMTRQLEPKPGDIERVFVPSVVDQVSLYYRLLWRKAPVIAPNPGQTSVIVAGCAAGKIADPTDAGAAKFPGGFRRIAHLLVPDVQWFVWKFVEPGHQNGMAYNGLVHLDGRFAWFPKPWVALDARTPTELQEN